MSMELKKCGLSMLGALYKVTVVLRFHSQVQLDSLQQQQDSTAAGGATGMSDSAADEVAAALNEITEASGGVEGRDDPEMMVGDNQQVFTVDTGVGSCDMAGMPTLADASLAETAARLQQVSCRCVYVLSWGREGERMC